MHLERVRLGPRVLRPHSLTELRVGDEAAAVAHQCGQDAELDPGQPKRAAAALGDTFAKVQGYIADHEPRATVAPMAPADGLDPSDQLLEGKGIPAIIVGYKLESRDSDDHGRIG